MIRRLTVSGALVLLYRVPSFDDLKQLELIVDKPKIAETSPTEFELEAGKKYAWCTCGLSDSQPFCNGAHKGTGFTPIVFEAEESKTVWFCQCKQTQTGPYCDGAHNSLPTEGEGGSCDGNGDGNSGGA